MTEQQKLALAEHLAEKVCGWRLEGDTYFMPSGGTWRAYNWEPLDDARHTEVVMRAWNKQGGLLCISVNPLGSTVFAYPAGEEYHGLGESSDWREAVCLAIGRASGWIKEE